MARSTVEVELLAEVTKATKAVEKFAKDTQKQLDGISIASTITAISSGFNLVRNTISPVVGLLQDAVREAIESEKQIAALANSMRLVGDFSQGAVAQIDQFSKALAETSALTDDQVIQSVALAKSFGLVNSEAKEVARAAAELSAITGDDLLSSTEKLTKTYNGFLDKGLKQLVPELKNLTKEQLQSGEAVRIVAERFEGSATAATKTFGGQVNQLTKSLSDLSEELGGIVTKSDGAKGGLETITDSVRALTRSIADGNFAKIFFDIRVGEGFDDAEKRLKQLEEGAFDVEQAMKKAMRAATSSGLTEQRIIADRKADQERTKALEEFNAIRTKIETAGLSEVEKINKEAADNIKVIREAIQTGAISDTVKANKFIQGIESDRIKRVAALEKAELEKSLAEQRRVRDEFNRELQDIVQNPAKLFIKTNIEGALNLTDFEKKLASAAGGFISATLKGAEGARKLLTSAASAAGQALFGPAGAVAGDIVDVLSQGPEEVKKQVQAFAQAIPELIQNLADSFPVLVEELVRTLPPALAKTMPTVAFGFSTALIANIPTIVRGFANGLIDAAKQFGQAVVDFIKTGGGIFGGEGGIGGGIGDFFSDPFGSIGDVFGFAEGGRVPNVSRFQGDRFPARLDAGEQVLSRDLSSRLEDFLNGNGGGGGGQPLQINLQIGLEQFAKVMLEADRLGYRVRA